MSCDFSAFCASSVTGALLARVAATAASMAALDESSNDSVIGGRSGLSMVTTVTSRFTRTCFRRPSVSLPSRRAGDPSFFLGMGEWLLLSESFTAGSVAARGGMTECEPLPSGVAVVGDELGGVGGSMWSYPAAPVGISSYL